MIPKIIHYCWFGGKPLPEMAIKCIESWKKYFPDYEIKRWDESNFDVNIIPYTQQAYEAKKYAFVSDYARFWILYKYGGIYFDTDVEVIKSMDDIIASGPFMGCENPSVDGEEPAKLGIAPGLGLAAYPKMPFYKEVLDYYENNNFIKETGNFDPLETVVKITTELLIKKGLKNTSDIQHIDSIYIYPNDVFCPMDYNTNKINITLNTRSIHYYSQSWLSRWQILKVKIIRLLGKKYTQKIVLLKKAIYRLFNL